MNRPKLFKALRIAWSVFFGLAAVLLCVLWVRSSWSIDSYWGGTSTTSWAIGCSSNPDRLVFGIAKLDGEQPIWAPRSFPIDRAAQLTKTIDALHGIAFGFGFVNEPKQVLLIVPHWFAVVICLTFSAAPWIRWSKRFSLRAMFVATTFAAVVLGIYAYSNRAPSMPPSDVGDFVPTIVPERR